MRPGGSRREIRTFGTTTGELLRLLDWLMAEGVEAAAMESTGVFWKPIWNILEGSITLILVNARHIKNVPGRKTDVKDCDWIAQLLQHGLLRAELCAGPSAAGTARPDPPSQPVGGRAVAGQHRDSEDAGGCQHQAGSVATDMLGVSGREMIRALIAGQDDPSQLAELARRPAAKQAAAADARRCGVA